MLAALASCATVPPSRPAVPLWGLLPADSELFLFADLQAARGLLEPLAGRLLHSQPGQLGKLLERTDELYAGLRFQPGAPPHAEAAVLGRYSPDAVGLCLDWSCGWRRSPGQPPFWRNLRLPVEVAAPERGLLLVAYGAQPDARGLLARWQNPGPDPLERLDLTEPGLRQELLAGSDLYAFLPTLPPALGQLPLYSLWLAARRQGEGYTLGALALLDQEPDPRVMLNVVRLAAAAVMRKAGLANVAERLKELEVRVSGRTVVVSGLSLGRGELLQMLGARPSTAD